MKSTRPMKKEKKDTSREPYGLVMKPDKLQTLEHEDRKLEQSWWRGFRSRLPQLRTTFIRHVSVKGWASKVRVLPAIQSLQSNAARLFAIRHLSVPILSAWFGLACLLTALVLLPAEFGVAHILALVGAFLLCTMSATTSLRDKTQNQSLPLENDRLDMLNDLLDRRLEQLQDKTWEISESSTRYRELLDAQNDMIVRCNASNELTFVNTAFCKTFGKEKSELLGHEFKSQVLDRDGATKTCSLRDLQNVDYPMHMVTRNGPRWLKWESHKLSSGDEGAQTQFIGHDVTQAKDTSEKLKHAAVLAQEGSRAKSRFLASMSHEIRTPMNGIVGMTSLLIDTTLDPEQRSYCQAIEQSAQILSSLIDEILDFSKIEAGKVVLRNEPFNIEKCLGSVVELLAPRAHEKGLQLSWYIEPDCPSSLRGDKARVHQILLNLLSNAIKFTDKGGITLRATVQLSNSKESSPSNADSLVRIDVRDTGIGMSKADCQAIFKEFEQTEDAVRRHSGGTGLGLIISKRLAQAMGGDVVVQSTYAKGSIFSLILPAMKKSCSSDEELANTQHPHMAEQVKTESSLNNRVLLVSDRELERETLASILQSHNIECHEASPTDAIEEIEKAVRLNAPFDRVLIDGSCGIPQAKDILAQVRQARSDVLGLVAVDAIERSLLPLFKVAGYQTHLIRPVRPSALLREIKSPHANKQPSGSAFNEYVQQVRKKDARTSHRAPTEERLILLAEDNAINQLLAIRIIEKAGHKSVSVKTGSQAVEYMRSALGGKKAQPDLILMDIMMPDMDGVTASQQIRELFKSAHGAAPQCPPIIAVTANAFEEDRQRYLEKGLNDYLPKPFEAFELANIINHWCSDANPVAAKHMLDTANF